MLVGYNDSDVWVHSIVCQTESIQINEERKTAVIVGTTTESFKLALHLGERGFRVIMTSITECDFELIRGTAGLFNTQNIPIFEKNPINALKRASIVIAFHKTEPILTREMVQAVPRECVVFDASIGSVSPDAIAWGVKHHIRMIRPDMRAALAGEIVTLMSTGRITAQLMGSTTIAGIHVVGGGIIGQLGDVVVDSATNPSRVIGIADGKGKIMFDSAEYSERIDTVERELIRRKAQL